MEILLCHSSIDKRSLSITNIRLGRNESFLSWLTQIRSDTGYGMNIEIEMPKQ